MKIKLWIYQNCSFDKGKLSASTHKYDAQTESLLDVVLHSETEVEIEAEPLELDYPKELLELRRRGEEFKKQALRDELAKLEVA